MEGIIPQRGGGLGNSNEGVPGKKYSSTFKLIRRFLFILLHTGGGDRGTVKESKVRAACLKRGLEGQGPERRETAGGGRKAPTSSLEQQPPFCTWREKSYQKNLHTQTTLESLPSVSAAHLSVLTKPQSLVLGGNERSSCRGKTED